VQLIYTISCDAFIKLTVNNLKAVVCKIKCHISAGANS